MRGWVRPQARIYSSNIAPMGYSSSYSSEGSSRSARASSVAAGSQSANSSSFVRSASVAPASSSLEGYSGFYGRQVALLDQKKASAASAKYDAAFTASNSAKASASVSATKTTAVQEKTTTTVEKSTTASKKVDLLREQQSSLEYGKSSKCSALRRAEIHAKNSGNDPRHVPVPRNVDDDICKMVADIHMSPYSGKEVSSASAISQQGRLKMDRKEKELNALTSSAMSYKSIYAKSASQLASEAMAACETESSNKKVRKTVIESSRKQVAAA